MSVIIGRDQSQQIALIIFTEIHNYILENRQAYHTYLNELNSKKDQRQAKWWNILYMFKSGRFYDRLPQKWKEENYTFINILGIMPLDFKANDGHQIEGTTLYVSYEVDNIESLIGFKTDKLFVKSSIPLPTGLKPGDIADISFNLKGKVEKIELIK